MNAEGTRSPVTRCARHCAERAVALEFREGSLGTSRPTAVRRGRSVLGWEDVPEPGGGGLAPIGFRLVRAYKNPVPGGGSRCAWGGAPYTLVSPILPPYPCRPRCYATTPTLTAPPGPRRIMKGSAVVAIGVGRGGFGCDNGACWRLAHAARLLPPKVVKSPKRSTLVSL
jgi:hypothetical protein